MKARAGVSLRDRILLLLTGKCPHPLAHARFDGVWPADHGFTVDQAACATCMRCGTTLNAAVRADVARQHGYDERENRPRQDGVDALEVEIGHGVTVAVPRRITAHISTYEGAR